MRTTLSIENDIARITMDDGKVNAMSTEMLEEICARLDEAEAGARVTILRGRPGIFSAGFDMPTFAEGFDPSFRMMTAGMRAILRMLSHPHPIVTACTGHAYPMGAFLMMCADVRYGVRGNFRIGMNEVAIGLTVPRFALALAKHRLSHAGFAHVTTGMLYSPEESVAAGYLDYVVSEPELEDAVEAAAQRLLAINLGSYRGTKRRMNEAVSATIEECAQAEVLRAELMELANA